MKKTDLVSKIADNAKISKNECTKVVDQVFAEITAALAAGENVTIAGFGTFSAKERAERVGVNPQKRDEKIVIPAMKIPSFKAGKALKEAVR